MPFESAAASVVPLGLNAMFSTLASWWSARMPTLFPVAVSHKDVAELPKPPTAASIVPPGAKDSGPPLDPRAAIRRPVATFHRDVVPELSGLADVSLVSPTARVLPSRLNATEDTKGHSPGGLGALNARIRVKRAGPAALDAGRSRTWAATRAHARTAITARAICAVRRGQDGESGPPVLPRFTAVGPASCPATVRAPDSRASRACPCAGTTASRARARLSASCSASPNCWQLAYLSSGALAMALASTR